MKRLWVTILLLQFFSIAEAQIIPNIDSAKLLADKLTSDTAKVSLYAAISFTYSFLQVDSSIAYAQKAIRMASELKFTEGEAAGMFSYGWALWAAGNYDKAIEAALKSLNLYKDLKNDDRIVANYEALAIFYKDAGDYEEALKYARLSKNLFESIIVSRKLPGVYPYTTIGFIFSVKNQIDSASFYLATAYEREKAEQFVMGYTLDRLGTVETQKKNYQKALDYYYAVFPFAVKAKNYFDIADTYALIAGLYQETGNMDSSIWYAKEVLNKPELSVFKKPVFDALTILAQNYRLNKNNDSTLKYLELLNAGNDSMFNKEKARAIQNLTFNEQLRQQEIETNRIQFQNKLKLYAVITLSVVFLLIGIILYRNNKVKQKANVSLHQQKQKIESTLSELKSTQSQLIHSEKMASLGELTAGIAHEIQNPLNFVNNFSEVNAELIDEAELAMDNGEINQAKELLTNLRENQSRINQHGKRADAIVKGMLQHSRSGKGQKEPADINALADEYLRLSYKSFRAKDPRDSANPQDSERNASSVILQTRFDPTIGTINIIPQEIARVLVNLYNNAFYAVSERKKHEPDGYEPTVSISTLRVDGKVEIRAKDNGAGIPQKVRDKIFQPFFTTKPTGQGTGLGLSLSYDIVKAHGGEISVDTREGEFTEFILRIPYNA